jgi:preprotein translocase subunit YajC
MSIIFLIALPVLMYFLLIRPQQKRAKEQRDLLAAVQEGDEIMTTGGIYGYVNAVEDDTIWLEIAENVEIRIAKGAVLKRIPYGEEEVEADEPPAITESSGAADKVGKDKSGKANKPSKNGSAPSVDAEDTSKGPEAEQH